MTFEVIHSQDAGNARSAFRVIEQPLSCEVEWVNPFLDREWVRQFLHHPLQNPVEPPVEPP